MQRSQEKKKKKPSALVMWTASKGNMNMAANGVISLRMRASYFHVSSISCSFAATHCSQNAPPRYLPDATVWFIFSHALVLYMVRVL